MTDYQKDKAAEKRAERIWPWVVFGVPGAFIAYWLAMETIVPIIRFLKSGVVL